MDSSNKATVAGFTQFIVMLLLNMVNSVYSSIKLCVQHQGCVENIIVNGVFVIVLAAWLLFLSALAYVSEHRRSWRLARLLLGCEGLVIIGTLVNIRHYPNLLGLGTSIVDFCLAAWVLLMSYPLAKKPAEDTPVAPAGDRPRRRVKQ